MKKNILIFNFVLFCKAILMIFMVASLTACKDDEPVNYGDLEFEIEEYSIPTEDALNVVSDLPAYVFSYSYQNFGAAFVNRLQNRVAVVNEETIQDLATVVLHSSQLKGMTDEWEVILAQLLLGRNIIIIEPTIDDFKFFCSVITATYVALNETEDGQELLTELDIIPDARQVLEAFYEMCSDPSNIDSMFVLDSDNGGVFAEAIAIRGNDFHIIDRMQGEAISETTFEYLADDKGTTEIIENPEDENSENTTPSQEITPYMYGVFADMLTQWINEHDYDIILDEEVRSRALFDLNTRASDTNKYSLEDISTVQKVQYTISASSPYEVGPELPVTVSFEICSVYMENEDCDYYCIYKNILSYNQILDCGPSGTNKKREWRTHPNFGRVVRKFMGSDEWVMYQYYGPFMRNIESRSKCHVDNEDVENNFNTDKIESAPGVRIEKYSPKNSIGSVDKTDSFSYGFDGGLCAAKQPSANLGFSVSWDTSTKQSIDDLDIISSTNNGTTEWKYIGQNLPESYYNLVLPTSHSEAPSIMRRQCEVDQSWIWRVPNPKGSYRLYDETVVSTCLMYFNDKNFKSNTEYVTTKTTTDISFLMMPPPRSRQTWMMNVSPYSDELNSMLAMTHNRFWKRDNHEFVLNDATDDSRITIEQFINDFRQDLDNKRHSWKNRNFKGTFTFSYYNINDGNNEPISFDFVVE